MRQYIKSLDAREGILINICHPLETKGTPELQAVNGVNDVLLPCSTIILNLCFTINISFETSCQVLASVKSQYITHGYIAVSSPRHCSKKSQTKQELDLVHIHTSPWAVQTNLGVNVTYSCTLQDTFMFPLQSLRPPPVA